MKSFALLKKELRECLPWLLAAMVLLLLLGFFSIFTQSLYWREHNSQQNEASGWGLNIYKLQSRNPLGDAGPVLLFVSLGLGLVLGIRQFCFSWFEKTWAFVLHRNLSRTSIVWIKIAAAALCQGILLAGIWTLLYLYAYFIQDYSPPPMFRTWLEGLFFIFLGGIPYLAAALSSMLPVKWYTTRLFPLGFAFITVLFAFAPLSLAGHFVYAGIILLILGIPLFTEFRHREF